MARLEHANITVGDAAHTAAWLGRVFGWTVRWDGSAMNGDGHTYHVGTETDYLALYMPKDSRAGIRPDYTTRGQLNHVGIVVDDLDATQKLVEAEGFTVHSHQVYEPGARFYFYDENDVEYEIVAYH